ncbi:MAG: hypothetical protein WCD76_19195 [Pyrinomonadaceae bacterium]
MNTNVNLAAVIGVLALLATGVVLAILVLIFIYTLVARKFAASRLALLAALALLALYCGSMLAFSLVSRERVLARGEEKYFCEIDCHLAYSVTDVRKSKTLGDAPGEATAKGLFYVVTLRTRFDEATVSARRGDGPLFPNPRSLRIFDAQGRSYEVSEEGRRALASAKTEGTPLDTPLRPGESYTTQLVFDLPADATAPTLLVNESDWPTRFIVGHENSPVHKATRFQL